MDSKAEQFEFAKKRGECRGRQRLDPEPRAMLIEAQKKFPEVAKLDVDGLLLVYFMHYAAGLVAPSEAARDTVDRWLGN